MKFVKVTGMLVTALVSTVLVGTSPSYAQGSTATASDVEIVKVTPNGSGCPAGTANASILGNGQFQVTYDSFNVDLAAGANSATKEKFCQLLLELTVPAGKQIAINSATYRGFMSIGAGVTAKLRTLYYFTQPGSTVVEDPMEVFTLASSATERDWARTATPQARAWSRCGGSFFFNAKGRLTLGSTGNHASAYIAMDTTNSTVYTYDMRACS